LKSQPSEASKRTKKARFFKAKQQQQQAAVEIPQVLSEISGFSQKELQDFQASFDLFDTDQEGTISADELRNVMLSLQGKDTYPHLQTLLTNLAEYTEDDDRLDFADYLALMERRTSGSDEEHPLAYVFSLFDVDGKGWITVQDLERVAIELGETDMTRQELQEMIERASSLNQKEVRLEDFEKMMTANLFS
jgi:calmodulin